MIPGMKRKITGLSALYLTYLKFTSVACKHRRTSTLILFFVNTNLDLERDTVHSNFYLL